jgi:hypothetical protein
VRVAYQHRLDSRLVCRKVVRGLERRQQVVVEVLIRWGSGNDDVDVLSCPSDAVETNCSLVSLEAMERAE